MRIISKFKDYYDSCMRYGMDEKFVYVRRREEIIINKKGYTSTPLLNVRGVGIHLPNSVRHPFYGAYSGRIGVCGKTYPYLRFRVNLANNEYFYDYESFERYYAHLRQDNRFEKDYEKYFKSVKAFFKESSVEENDSVFLDYNAPIVAREEIRDEAVVIKNPSLEGYQFYKVMDSFTVYQEIGMYLRNQLCDKQEADMPVGDDVVIAESKGYDKWSFRKEPTKKGEKK